MTIDDELEFFGTPQMGTSLQIDKTRWLLDRKQNSPVCDVCGVEYDYPVDMGDGIIRCRLCREIDIDEE